MNMNQFQEFKSRRQAVRGSIHRYKWNSGSAITQVETMRARICKCVLSEDLVTQTRMEKLVRLRHPVNDASDHWEKISGTLSYAVAGIGQWNYCELCEAFHALFYNNNKKLYR